MYLYFAAVRGEWTPLVTLAEQCGYTIERQDADVVITAPFITCGVTVQVIYFADGNGVILKYCIELGWIFFYCMYFRIVEKQQKSRSNAKAFMKRKLGEVQHC